MIQPDKLFQLEAGQKRRKLALTFGELERDIAGISEPGTAYNFPQMSRADYTKAVTNILLADPKLPAETNAELTALLQEEPFDERRVCNVARNALLAIIGTFPAEWDLDIAPQCTDPSQSHALRSGMGCIETLGYTRCALSELPEDKPVFVLETGGTPLNEFKFPKEGIVIIGSEELGVSPEALKRGSYGRVSIPMTGLKASLNVGVAFGILMQAWVNALRNYF